MFLILRTIVGLAVAAGVTCATAPAAEELQAIAPGVSVIGVKLGGLTAQPARTTIEARVVRPVVILAGSKRIVIPAARFGTHAAIDEAVRAALDATPSSRIGLPTSYSPLAVANFVATLAGRTYRPPRSARVIGATAKGPEFRRERRGIELDEVALHTQIARQLLTGTRAPIELHTLPVLPARTVATIGPVIVITRGANTLRFYDGPRLVRTFPVATGQAIYPTPSGLFSINDMQRNPWWYPPTYDSWAKGLKPVPPGPGNPLGTRWMGTTAAGVGIHATNAESSIGYSVSHGCIRMHVVDAEWLFEHVHVGTPVAIL